MIRIEHQKSLGWGGLHQPSRAEDGQGGRGLATAGAEPVGDASARAAASRSGRACGIEPKAQGVRARPRFAETGRDKRAGHWRAANNDFDNDLASDNDIWLDNDSSNDNDNQKLHIDDGCIGGGTSIPHFEYLWYSDPSHTNFFDIMDGEDTNGNGVIEPDEPQPHFNPDRYGIFHYCIFGHKMADEDTDGDGTLNLHSTSRGWGQPNSYYFFCADANLGTATLQAHNFMHELGHNLLGPDHCSHACAMQSGTDYVKYCNDCWDAIDIAGCLP